MCNLQIVLSCSGAELRLHSYTSDGELAQVAFAARGVQKCSPAVGFLTDNKMGVLLTCYPAPSPLAIGGMPLIEVKDRVGICTIGYNADCLRIKTDWRGIVENHKFTFGEPPTVDKIASKLSAVLTSGLYPEKKEAFARPLATSLLFLAHDHEIGEGNRLIMLENSGAIYQCHGLASLGSIAGKSFDMDAIEASLTEHLDLKNPQRLDWKGIIDRVAGQVFGHVRQGYDEQLVELRCECCVFDRSGHGHLLPIASSLEELRENLAVLEQELFPRS